MKALLLIVCLAFVLPACKSRKKPDPAADPAKVESAGNSENAQGGEDCACNKEKEGEGTSEDAVAPPAEQPPANEETSGEKAAELDESKMGLYALDYVSFGVKGEGKQSYLRVQKVEDEIRYTTLLLETASGNYQAEVFKKNEDGSIEVVSSSCVEYTANDDAPFSIINDVNALEETIEIDLSEDGIVSLSNEKDQLSFSKMNDVEESAFLQGLDQEKLGCFVNIEDTNDFIASELIQVAELEDAE